MSLSNDILDAIDGAEETKGRDSRYQEWADRAKAMEDALLAILPFVPKSSAKDGMGFSRVANVHAADKVRDAIAKSVLS